MLDLPGVAAHWAISSFFDGFHASDSIYSYGADLQGVEVRESGKLKLAAGRVHITSRITRAQLDFNFAVLHGGGHNLCAGICESRKDFPAFVARMQHSLTETDFTSCCELFSEYFGDGIYSLKSMFRDERHRIVSTIVNATLEDIDGLYREVYEENTALIGFLRSIHLPLPPILRVSSEFVLSNEIRRCLSEGTDAERIGQLLQTAAKYGVRIDSSVQSAFRERLNLLADEWSKSPLEMQRLAQVEALAALVRNAPFETDLWNTQNVYNEVMMVMAALAPSHIEPAWRQQFQRLGDHLGIAQLDIGKPRAAAGPRQSKTAKQAPIAPKPEPSDDPVLVMTAPVPEIPPVT